MKPDELLTTATTPNPFAGDDQLRSLTREQALLLDRVRRMRWFYLVQVMHVELKRVTDDLMELLEPDNDVKIVSIIGMTGIGKTTLANNLLQVLDACYRNGASPSDIPVIYVRAPANGERSLSWTGLYNRILEAGREVMLRHKRAAIVTKGELRVVRGSRATLGELRHFIEQMLTNRNVRVLVIDEALHLLRFDDYTAVMDTLKSLADIHTTKLVLIGAYDIAKLMTEYAQVARRSEIVHYRRYVTGELNPEALTPDQEEFRKQVVKLQSLWPCAAVPQLEAIWHELMRASLGSVGLLKAILLRMASLQMGTPNEALTLALMKKAFKAQKSNKKIEDETVLGEVELKNACYGDTPFASNDELVTMFERLKAA